MLAQNLEDQKLGQILMEMGKVTPQDLAEVLKYQTEMQAQKGRNFRLGELLVFTKKIDMPTLHQALARQTQKMKVNREDTSGLRDEAESNRMLRDKLANHLENHRAKKSAHRSKKENPEPRNSFIKFFGDLFSKGK